MHTPRNDQTNEHPRMTERDQIIADIRKLILELELRPRHLFLTRTVPQSTPDPKWSDEQHYAWEIAREREQRVRGILLEMREHGLSVHDVCTGWMLPPAPVATFGLLPPSRAARAVAARGRA